MVCTLFRTILGGVAFSAMDLRIAKIFYAAKILDFLTGLSRGIDLTVATLRIYVFIE